MAITFDNTNGAVCIADGGTPRVITVKARTTISGGWWVNGSSAQGVVGSGAETYSTADIEGYPVATQIGSEVIGLALTDIPSGTYGPVGMRGIYLLPGQSGTRIGSIFAGWPVLAGSAGTVFACGSNTLVKMGQDSAVGPFLAPVGRALTDGGIEGQFIAVSLNV